MSERHSDALAYFITFHTYATWLHGRADGSVDRLHNIPGTPILPPDLQREHDEIRQLKAKPVHLTAAMRDIVAETIREVCTHRNWTLLALNVRTNHVHAVVTGRAATGRAATIRERSSSQAPNPPPACLRARLGGTSPPPLVRNPTQNRIPP